MFQIFIVDKENSKYVELDSDGVDFTTMFSIANINDISVRKETLTKNLNFKSTSVNDNAFGYAYHLNKFIDDSNTIRLGFNYSPQKAVDCLIYENSQLITKGKLTLIDLTIAGNGITSYQCQITGDVYEFNGLIADKMLTDIDLSDLKHTYSTANIFNSWQNALTLGYVYPLIQYGNDFKTTADENSTYINAFNVQNFKPAVFVTKIFDKIFDDAGYKYEIKGDNEFKNYFKSLIIPNNDEKISNTVTFTGGSRPLSIIKTTGDDRNAATQTQTGDLGVRVHLTLDNLTNSLSVVSVASPFATQASPSSLYRPNKVFNITKAFKSGARIDFEYTFRNSNNAPVEITAVVELLERDVIASSDLANYHNSDNWTSVASTTLTVPNTGGADVVKTGTLNIAEREFSIGKQFTMKITFYAKNTSSSGELGTNNFFFNVYKTDFLFPAQIGDKIVTDIVDGDNIVPTLASGVKQLDFLQSIRNLFNLYVYTNQDTKTIYFEKYDDYYSLTSGELLSTTALDWSKKIDYSSQRKYKSNLTIPKNYNYKWKSDNDFVNDYYQKIYNKTYGDYNLVDSNGITPKNDITLIFSPTPLLSFAPSINGSTNLKLSIPWIYKPDSNNNVLPTLSNIRILSFSGLKEARVDVITEKFNGTNWVVSIVNTRTSIPLVSNFYFVDGVAKHDLHFGKPERIFFNESSEYINAEYSFSNYQNQIKELKNPNVIYVECEALLNEVDINNLDLKTPVFIDMGDDGHAYFKVLTVDYKSSNQTSSITLQKINV